MSLPKQCLVVLAEFTLLHYITSFFAFVIMWLFNMLEKKGSALKNATGVKIKKASADTQLLKAQAV